MEIFKSKATLLAGTSYDEVYVHARKEHKKVESLTKRHAYVRSKYFNNAKIFLDLFWPHLLQKHIEKRTKRLKLYTAAIDLMRNTHSHPHTVIKHGDYLHRFYGKTRDGEEYCVQVKQDKRSGRLDFMSVFPKKLP